MPFQKGNQLGKNSVHQRRDLTMELIAQLDEVMKYKHPLTKEQRTFKQRIVRNLIRRAATCGDEFNTNGKLIKEGVETKTIGMVREPSAARDRQGRVDAGRRRFVGPRGQIVIAGG